MPEGTTILLAVVWRHLAIAIPLYLTLEVVTVYIDSEVELAQREVSLQWDRDLLGKHPKACEHLLGVCKRDGRVPQLEVVKGDLLVCELSVSKRDAYSPLCHTRRDRIRTEADTPAILGLDDL